MKNDKSPSPDSNFILTAADVNAAIDALNNCTADPLARFPALRRFVIQLCNVTIAELVGIGAPAEAARRAAAVSYYTAAVGALPLQHACIDGSLSPDNCAT